MMKNNKAKENFDELVQALNSSNQQDFLLEGLIYFASKARQKFTRQSLLAGLPLVSGRLTPELFNRACKRASLESKVQKRALHTIPEVVLPALVLLRDNKAVLLLEAGDEQVQVVIPGNPAQYQVTIADFKTLYSGFVFLVKHNPGFDERVGFFSSRYQSHWFWGTISQSWKIYRDVLVASALINLFVLSNPLFVMNVYDRVVPNDAIETLWALAIGVTIAYIFDITLKVLRVYFIEVAGKKSDILLSSFILERVLGAQFREHPASTGSFVAQLREFETVRSFITSSTVTALVDIPFILLFLAVMVYIGGPVAWVPVLIIPVIIIYALFVQKALQKSVAFTMAASTQKNACLVEGVANLEAVKSLSGESRIQQAWEQACAQLAKWSLSSRMLSTSASLVAAFLQQIGAVLIVVVGVYAIAERELTMGALIASVILGGRILAPLAQVVGLLVQFQQSKMALESLDAIVRTDQERAPDRHYIRCADFKGDIEFRDVRFRYPNEEQDVLKGVSFKVKAGEHVAIIGRLGSGKTTLQKLLIGLYHPDNGSVLVDNLDVKQIDPADLRQQIAYVAQDSDLFYGSLRENLTWKHESIDDEELLRIAGICNISEFANAHPMGFDRLIRERGEGLSGGQKQAVNIARSLVNNPSIFLLDEPTTSMDNTSEARLISNLKKEMAGKTLLLVTHKTSLLAMVDRIIVVDSGQIVADGEKDRVLQALKLGQLRVS